MKILLLTIAIAVHTFNITAQTYNPTTVYTRKQTSLQGELLTSADYTAAQKASIKSQTLAEHPNATFLADATYTYNCHGYAWHLTEGNSNIVWINQYDRSGNPNVYKYWTDGSFIQVCNETDADKIHYYNGDHSAVYSTIVVGKYESKWGSTIRIRHDPTDVPSIYNAQYRRYYASTKISGSTSNLCTGTRILSVKNIPGATYTWTKSSTLTVVSGGGPNQITVQRNGSSNGAAWVPVQITTPCSGTSATSRADFTVGAPAISGNYSDDYTHQTYTLVTVNHISAPTSQLVNVNVDPSSTGATSYTWSKTFGAAAWQQMGNKLVFTFGSSYGSTANFQLVATNACGSTTFNPGFSLDGWSFALQPNPARDHITVSAGNNTGNLLTERVTDKKLLYAIKIIDRFGTVRKLFEYKTGIKSVTISLSDLNSGTYLIAAFNGYNWNSKPLIIQR